MNIAAEAFSLLRPKRYVLHSIFTALSLAAAIIYPIANLFFPLDKDILLVSNFSDLNLGNSTHYPVPNFIALVEQHGYIAEQHTVKTADGYLLGTHRISGSSSNPKKYGKPVAYLQHGLIQSSDSFVLIGPDSDLAFQLVKAGYDVWLGNCRGNTYSKRHVSMSPEWSDFWDFSFHEIALYDLTANIDYILNVTGQRDLTYYGFSMGTTMSYILLSSKPEYNKKMQMVYSLAPVAYWKHEYRNLISALDSASDIIKGYLKYKNANELLPQTAVNAYIAEKYCTEKNVILQPICAAFIASFFSVNTLTMNMTALPSMITHNPAGGSRITVLHFHQLIEDRELRPYDYGSMINLRKYGQVKPPTYNLTKIEAPVVLWYGNADDIVNPKDVAELAKQLPNLVSSNAVAYDNFKHMDFLWSINAKSLVYDHIIRKLVNTAAINL